MVRTRPTSFAPCGTRTDLSTLLDTSVLLASFLGDALSGRADAALEKVGIPVVSDFAGAEFASGVARNHRMGRLSHLGAQTALRTFDAWCVTRADMVQLNPVDIALATTWLRRLDLNLRAPDALHLAMASRLGVPILTFDTGMAAAARTLGLALAEEP